MIIVSHSCDCSGGGGGVVGGAFLVFLCACGLSGVGGGACGLVKREWMYV